MRPFIGNGIDLAFPALSQAEERVPSLHDGLVQLQLGEPLPLPLSSSKKSVPSKIPDLPTRQSFQIFSFPCKLQFDVDIDSTFSLTPATTDTTQAAGRALQSCIDARPRRRGRLHLDRTECRLECGCGAAETSANRLLLLFPPPSPSLTRHPAGTGRLRARADDATSLARVSSLDSRCVEATAKLRHRVSDGCPSHPLLTMAQSFGRGRRMEPRLGNVLQRLVGAMPASPSGKIAIDHRQRHTLVCSMLRPSADLLPVPALAPVAINAPCDFSAPRLGMPLDWQSEA